MTHQPITLNEINFSQPDDYFVFQEQTYRVKQYLKKYFFKYNSNQYPDFIYSFRYSLEPKKIIANRTFGSDLKITPPQSDYRIGDAIAAIKAIARVSLLCGCNKKVGRIRNNEFSIHHFCFIFLSSF